MLDADSASWLIGFIWALFCGLAIGNYATNPIYRLPRSEPLFGRTPYCGDCNTELKPKDLFPILSWFSTMGKCRYCGASVPVAYVVAEILVTALFVLAYCRFGFGDEFILVGLGGTALLMIVMMEVIDRFFSDKTWVFFLAMGAFLRILREDTLGGMTYGAFYAALFPLAYWWWKERQNDKQAVIPDYVKLWVAAGVWLVPQALVMFAIAWGLLEVLVRIGGAFLPTLRSRLPLSATYSAALLTFVLCPKLALLQL